MRVGDLKGNPWKPAGSRQPVPPPERRQPGGQARPPGVLRNPPGWGILLGVSIILLGGIAAAVFAWRQLEVRRAAVEAERSRLATYLVEREAAFEQMPTLTANQQQQLRRSLNSVHLERAQALGIERIPRRDQVEDRVPDLNLVRIDETDAYWVSRLTHSFPYVTPDAAAALEAIGARFHARLAARGLPPLQFNVTSVLRTQEDQARLRGVNVNAARGPSSHEYGTTFDVHYQRFRYGGDARGELEDALGPLAYGFLYDEFARELSRFYEQMATRYATRIGASLGRALIELEDEGQMITIRERLQPVYHVTVNRPLAGG